MVNIVWLNHLAKLLCVVVTVVMDVLFLSSVCRRIQIVTRVSVSRNLVTAIQKTIVSNA